MRTHHLIPVLILVGFVVVHSPLALAARVTLDEIVPIPGNTVNSGNGTLDLRMFTYSGSQVNNAAGTFNGDNANRSLPQGGGADIHSFAESYVTTAGKLKDFYRLNFPTLTPQASSISELALFLDLNETGATAQANNWLRKLDIVLNPTSINGNPDPLAGDVTGAQQEAINQICTGGTLLSSLGTAYNLPVVSQGAGAADYVIRTGINLFSLNGNDVLLFNISMDTLNNGAEEIFISGSLRAIPEPSAPLFLLTALGVGMGWRRRGGTESYRPARVTIG